MKEIFSLYYSKKKFEYCQKIIPGYKGNSATTIEGKKVVYTSNLQEGETFEDHGVTHDFDDHVFVGKATLEGIRGY